MTYYKTWVERGYPGRVMTDAPPRERLVAAGDYDRLREALERIDAVTFTSGPEYGLTLARIARAALQKAGDD